MFWFVKRTFDHTSVVSRRSSVQTSSSLKSLVGYLIDRRNFQANNESERVPYPEDNLM